jgi:hypothetical protein
MSNLFAISPSESLFIQTDDFSVIKQQCKNTTPKTLIILDIDHTLLTYKDGALHPDILFSSPITKNKISTHDYLIAHGIAAVESSIAPLDEESAGFFAALLEAGRKIITLTKATTGEVHNIPIYEEKRLEILKNLGFDFSHSFPTLLNSIPLEPSPVNFTKGMISTCGLPKVTPLESFLGYLKKEIEFIPDKIVFVDDDENNVKQLQEYCLQKAISFTGIHYMKAKNLPSPSGDLKLYTKQYEILLKERRWPSEIEAAERLTADTFKARII